MSIRRAATKRVPDIGASGTKAKKGYEVVQQGIKELYPQDGISVPEVDIVFVPGLGAHPEESWQSVKTGYNWASDKNDGIAKDFPKSRILLYQYESAWTGPLKTKQFLGGLATNLLYGLKANREKYPQRPIVLIGHSMGGLVIAKALIIADSRRDLFPRMFECIASCAFFGTPFGGAPIAAAAAMLAHLGERIDIATSSKLLDIMKPGDEGLRELKDEFIRLSSKLSQKIELFCFWETQPTDFAQMIGMPLLSSLSRALIPKGLSEFVNRESATIPGIDEMGLSSNHRDLVKFDDFKDARYQLAREPLKRLIHSAALVVRNRLQAVRDIDMTMVNSIMDILDSVPISKARKLLATRYGPSSWIPHEVEYLDWIAQSETEDQINRRENVLYVRGPEGRGKTSATMAVLESVDNMVRKDETTNTGQAPILIAYFFCDNTPDFSTAEDVLKSIIKQLISQQATLAPYAKHFVKKKREDSTSAVVKLSVENLWQTLQDMLMDEFIGRRIYIIINNVHALSEDADSTYKLLRFINTELMEAASTDSTRRVPIRWFFTSREAHHVEQAVNVTGARLIDLEDEKYSDQVQIELRRHAQKKVASLGIDKKYNRALSYFATSLIGKRASNTQWIDIACTQLEEIPAATGDLRIRRILEAIPQDLSSLLESAWLQIFRLNPNDADFIKELLRTLVLTFEDPTEEELAVLSGLTSTDEAKQELQRLIEMCRPLLVVKKTNKGENRISFLNIVVKNHLLQEDSTKRLLDWSEVEIKWQHGMLALRCLSHLQEALSYESLVPPKQTEADANQGNANASTADDDQQHDSNRPVEGDSDEKQPDPEEQDVNSGGDQAAATQPVIASEDNKTAVTDTENTEHEDDDGSSADAENEANTDEAMEVRDKALQYVVKHWLHHAARATTEIAEELSMDSFWERHSLCRRRWVIEHNRLTGTLEGFNIDTLNGLHIAAAIGFRQLVAALIRNGHQEETNLRDNLINTPLHLAAYFGRANIVEELLNRGASIDDGSDIKEQTPLHMAAEAGHVKVMKKLLSRGANAHAFADDVGTPVNTAICSGNREAVELLVQHGVSLTEPNQNGDTCFTLAALFSDLSMFEYLTEAHADKIPAEQYDKALIKAAEAGRAEVFNKLLKYDHPQTCFQDALHQASEEENWDIVMILLDKCKGLDCNEVFLKAATITEQQDRILLAAHAHTDNAVTPKTLSDSLYGATDLEKETTVRILLEEFKVDANATGEEYGNALTASAYDGTLHILKLLLNNGANIADPAGWPLQSAAAQGHSEVVRELLNRGADVNSMVTNSKFTDGTAIMAACEAGQADIVEILLEHKANPDLGAGDNKYPIIAATKKGESKIVEMLIEAKATIDVFGSWQNTSAFILAAACLPRASLELMLNAGADIDLADDDGDTALIIAGARGDKECVQFLLDKGANPLCANKLGHNVLQGAYNNNNDDCVSILIEVMATYIAALHASVLEGSETASNIVRHAENLREQQKLAAAQKEAEESAKEDAEPDEGAQKDEDSGKEEHQQDSQVLADGNQPAPMITEDSTATSLNAEPSNDTAKDIDVSADSLVHNQRMILEEDHDQIDTKSNLLTVESGLELANDSGVVGPNSIQTTPVMAPVDTPVQHLGRAQTASLTENHATLSRPWDDEDIILAGQAALSTDSPEPIKRRPEPYQTRDAVQSSSSLQSDMAPSNASVLSSIDQRQTYSSRTSFSGVSQLVGAPSQSITQPGPMATYQSIAQPSQQPVQSTSPVSYTSNTPTQTQPGYPQEPYQYTQSSIPPVLRSSHSGSQQSYQAYSPPETYPQTTSNPMQVDSHSTQQQASHQHTPEQQYPTLSNQQGSESANSMRFKSGIMGMRSSFDKLKQYANTK